MQFFFWLNQETSLTFGVALILGVLNSILLICIIVTTYMDFTLSQREFSVDENTK